MGGNAVTLQAPFQFSAGSYAPRWIHGGVALLLHRGDYKRFGSNGCGIEGVQGVCEAGAVVGFDLWGGYTHKIFLRRFPYLVPMARGGIGFARWGYPDIGASRQQARESAISVSARLGGGVRFFLTSNIGIGADVNFQIGLVRHKDRPIMANNRPADVEHTTEPLFGLELFPLVGEFRF